MTVVQVYEMLALPGERDALEIALSSLAEKIDTCPGCLGVDVLLPIGAPYTIAMLEYWRADDCRVAAGAALGREAFTAVRALSRDIHVRSGTADVPITAPGTSARADRWWRGPFRIVADDHATQSLDHDRKDPR